MPTCVSSTKPKYAEKKKSRNHTPEKIVQFFREEQIGVPHTHTPIKNMPQVLKLSQ
jgi:hypothetical protein